jgi:hypothetical protein
MVYTHAFIANLECSQKWKRGARNFVTAWEVADLLTRPIPERSLLGLAPGRA